MTTNEIQLNRNSIAVAMIAAGQPVNYTKSEINGVITEYDTNADFVGSPLVTAQNNVVKAVIDAYKTSLIPPAPADATVNREINAMVKTTDATQTTLFTGSVPSNTAYAIEATVVARRTGGSAGAAGDCFRWKWEGIVTNISGTVSVVGSPVTVTQKTSGLTWVVTPSTPGNTVVIKVTGAANNNITWQLMANVINII